MADREQADAPRPAFDDRYSKQAAVYARFRPLYPDALFAHLASLAPGQALAWDAGTGSGQAAVGLAAHFERVWATDASPEQLSHATPTPRVTYRLATSSDSGLEAGSADLVTAAAAAHWFDLEPFYAEVRRVLRPGGVIAVWTYYHLLVSPEVDAVTARYADEVLADTWSPKIDYVRQGYRTLPFPFDELPAPEMALEAPVRLADLVGYLHTWSSTQAYRDAHGVDPVALVRPELEQAWGDPEAVRRGTWPLWFRIGRVRG